MILLCCYSMVSVSATNAPLKDAGVGTDIGVGCSRSAPIRLTYLISLHYPNHYVKLNTISKDLLNYKFDITVSYVLLSQNKPNFKRSTRGGPIVVFLIKHAHNQKNGIESTGPNPLVLDAGTIRLVAPSPRD